MIFSLFLSVSYAQEWENGTTTTNWWSKCWNDEIELNTNIPWIWDNNGCIKKEEATDTFWKLMWGLMKLALNITVAIAFIALIASGIMIAVSGINQSTAWKWKELIKKVILWIVLIWLSWIILHTINPNFFKNSIILQTIKYIK